jgi:hypothetical protein
LLGREKRELDDAVEDFKDRANAALDRKEREMNATPEEKFAMEQERGAEIDAELEAVRRRIERDSGGS